jgi:hypothetical protein
MNTEEIEKLLVLLTERVSSLERIVALQHQENGRLYAAIQAHQAIFDRMVAQASAAPLN